MIEGEMFKQLGVKEEDKESDEEALLVLRKTAGSAVLLGPLIVLSWSQLITDGGLCGCKQALIAAAQRAASQLTMAQQGTQTTCSDLFSFWIFW